MNTNNDNVLKIFFSSSSANLEDERGCLKDFEAIWNKFKHPKNPIEILKWENGNHSRESGVTFQEGIDPDILGSDLVIFLFSHELGKHTKEEYNLCRINRIRCRILLKEPNVSSLHNQPMKWLNKFVQLKRFINTLQKQEGELTGEKPIVSLSDFQWQLANCIESHIAAIETDKASNAATEFANNLSNKNASIDMMFLNTLNTLQRQVQERLNLMSE